MCPRHKGNCDNGSYRWSLLVCARIACVSDELTRRRRYYAGRRELQRCQLVIRKQRVEADQVCREHRLPAIAGRRKFVARRFPCIDLRFCWWHIDPVLRERTQHRVEEIINCRERQKAARNTRSSAKTTT